MAFHPVIRESGNVFTVDVQLDCAPEDLTNQDLPSVVVYMTITPVIVSAFLFETYLADIPDFELDFQTPNYGLYSQAVNLVNLEWGVDGLMNYLKEYIPAMVDSLDRLEAGNFFNRLTP